MISNQVNRRLKILHIIPSFQHPKVRGPDRHYRFLRELSQRHNITLLAPIRSEISEEAIEEVASYTEKFITFDLTSGSKHSNGSHNPLKSAGLQLEQLRKIKAGVQQMKKTFNRLVDEGDYDVVFFHGKNVFDVIEDFDDLPIVIDFCDASSMRVRKKMEVENKAKLPLLWLRYLRVRETERNMIKKTPYVAFISSRDREAVAGPEDRWRIVPNGLDLQYWKRQTYNPQPNCLVFTGVMSYSPNADAAIYLIDHILPLLRKRVENLEILIVGRDPTPALLEKAERHSEVAVTGFVEDVRTYLERAEIFAAPLRYGSGMQNKIQEALAMEVPIVTTPIVAEGMRTEDGDSPPLWVAEGAEAFADKVTELLAEKATRQRLAIEGRRFAQKHFDWARSAREFEEMCYQAIAGKNSRRHQ